MKKILKLMFVLCLSVMMMGCSSSSDTSEQEEVVNNFFSYIKAGDTDKVQEICTEEISEELGLVDLDEQFEELLDEDSYGTVFVKEAEAFKTEVFGSLFKEYTLGEVEVDGDTATVTVTGKFVDYQDISFDMNEAQELATAYTTEHMDELQEIYLNEGQDAMQVAIFDAVAAPMFEILKSQLADAPVSDMTSTIELTKDGSDWIISGIDL